MAPITRLKRRLLVVAVLTMFAFGALWLLWPEPVIGPASYQRIELGMTEAEIEAMIGLPPSHHYPDRIILAPEPYGYVAAKGNYPGEGNMPSVEWRGSKYSIVVFFENGQASYCGLFELGKSMKPPDLLVRIRNWLGW